MSHLIFEGTLDRFPGLKICAAHGGGFLPSYADRSDAVITTFPNRVGPLPKKKPTQYLKDGQLYFDSIMFTGEAMRHLIAETGVDQVVIGTDYPFPWNRVPVDHILSIPGLSDDDKIAILGGTAAKLLGIAVRERGWLTLRPAKLSRGRAEHLTEMARQMTLVGEACCDGNFR